MRTSFVLWTLKRRPKRNSFFGVSWTQWPWPSLVAKAMYRRFGPTSSMSREQLEKWTKRTSLLYVLVGWTAFGGAFAYIRSGSHKDKQIELPEEVKKYPSEVQALAALTREEDLGSGAKLYTMRIRGLRVGEWNDATEGVKDLVKYKDNQSDREAMKERAERREALKKELKYGKENVTL